jgi:hypothetical protein
MHVAHHWRHNCDYRHDRVGLGSTAIAPPEFRNSPPSFILLSSNRFPRRIGAVISSAITNFHFENHFYELQVLAN